MKSETTKITKGGTTMPGINHKGGYSRTHDILGQRFGRLVVIEKSEPFRNKDGSIQCAGWKCLCDCGNYVVVRSNSLKMKGTKSCGCLNKEKPSNNVKHHMSTSKIYSKYKGMLARCNNPQNAHYLYYGGKGIRVCDEWTGKDGFLNFYNWAIVNGYKDELSIERMNIDGNYCPENCKWIPRHEQAYNKSNSFIVNGVSIAKLSREKGIVPPHIARSRIKLGWNIEDATSIPIMRKGGKCEKGKITHKRAERNSNQ